MVGLQFTKSLRREHLPKGVRSKRRGIAALESARNPKDRNMSPILCLVVTRLIGLFLPVVNVAAVVLAACLLLPTAFAADWEIDEFEVLPVAPASGIDGSVRYITPLIIQAMRQTEVFDPDLPGIFDPVEVEAGTLAAIEGYLHESAQLMAQWGFPSPALHPVVNYRGDRPAYRIYLVENLDNAGEYHVDCDLLAERIILLNANSIISGGRITPRGHSTIAHELFHAVQYATPFFACSDGSVGDWITEGSARGVGWDVAQKLRPSGYSTHENERWGARDYNRRLTIPSTVDDDENVANPMAFGTSSFWRYLAEFHAMGSKPGPGENATHYGYLAQMFSQAPVDRDCLNISDRCHAEINWLADQVSRLFGEPLRIIYTNFAEMLTVYGHYRRGIDRGSGGRGDPWRREVYRHQCTNVVLRPTDEQRIHEETLVNFDEDAAVCFELDVNGFDRDIILEIKADATEDGLKVEHLNATIADQPIEARKGDVDPLDPQTGHKSATWHFELPDQETSFLVLTNMADIPGQSTLLDGLKVSLVAVEQYARFGTGSQASGPTAAEIDAPLAMAIPEIKEAYVMPGPLEQHLNAGMSDVCMMQFQFQNPEFGDHLLLKMDQEGPFRPGSYDVHPGGSFKTENFPGQFATLMTWGPNNPSTAGWTLSYKGDGGVVRLKSVSKHFITGEATLNMTYSSARICIDPSGQRPNLENRIICPPHLKNLVIQVEFGVKPQLVSQTEILGLSVAQCTQDRPPRTASGSPPRSPAAAASSSPTRRQHGDNTPTGPGTGPPSNGLEEEEEFTSTGTPVAPSAEAGTERTPSAPADPSSSPEQVAQWGYLNEPGGPFGTANFLEVSSIGDVVTRTVIGAENLSLTGGCAPSTTLSIGLFRGTVQDESWFQLAFDSSENLATGQIGVVALKEVRWDNGTDSPPNIPPEMNIRVPNRFTGTGTLEITNHDATTQSRRMIGRVRASLHSRASGEDAELEARFDINMSCGVQ